MQAVGKILGVATDRDAGPGAGRRSSGTQTIAQYFLPCHSASIRVSRIPATPTPGRRLALFLPGIMAAMNATCLRVMPLTGLFDIIACELAGHGISEEVGDVSPEAFAREYAALIDRYVPPPHPVHVIGESYGGLLGAALARLRPDRVRQLVLLDTPVCLTRPPLAELLSALWHQLMPSSSYLRRIFTEVFGFDPQTGDQRAAANVHAMLDGLQADCTVLAGAEDFMLGVKPVLHRPPSQVTGADLGQIDAYRQVTVLPRIPNAGHCLLLDDPAACVAALADRLAD